MKRLLEVVREDFRREGITRKEMLKYGVVAPIVLILTCMLAECINAL